MDFFYTPVELISPASLRLIDEEFHHCCNVLRKEIGETIAVLDGMGNCFEVEITTKGRDYMQGNILSRLENYHEPVVSLTLAVGILKNPAKFDFIVEKATELGVKKIIPMISRHTVAKSFKHERLHNLALAAMKQCGRGYLPEITSPLTFDEIVTSPLQYSEKYIAYEFTESNIRPAIGNQKSVIVFVGSEGGFSNEEIEQAKKNNVQLLSLGERRLRTETAAIVVCAMFANATTK